jgi:hypothetical protein
VGATSVEPQVYVWHSKDTACRETPTTRGDGHHRRRPAEAGNVAGRPLSAVGPAASGRRRRAGRRRRHTVGTGHALRPPADVGPVRRWSGLWSPGISEEKRRPLTLSSPHQQEETAPAGIAPPDIYVMTVGPAWWMATTPQRVSHALVGERQSDRLVSRRPRVSLTR